MVNEEVAPRSLSLDELELIHNFSADAGSEVTAEVLMHSYFLRKNRSLPPEESGQVKLNLLMYDKDWERLIEAGVPPLQENDPRALIITNDMEPPAHTNLVNTALFEARDVMKTKWMKQAEKDLEELRDDTKREVLRSIGKVGLSRVNELLQLLGIAVDEHGEPTYGEVEEAQVEGVRRVARLMSPKYRDAVRTNPKIFDADDVQALESTPIEDPELREKYRALLRDLGKDE